MSKFFNDINIIWFKILPLTTERFSRISVSEAVILIHEYPGLASFMFNLQRQERSLHLSVYFCSMREKNTTIVTNDLDMHPSTRANIFICFEILHELLSTFYSLR